MHKLKEQILMHNENSVELVKNLRNLTEEQWRTPTLKGKWTIADIIGHFPAWDEDVLNHRIPSLLKEQGLPMTTEGSALNQQSENRNQTKEETIAKFIAARRSLVIAINNLEDELWEKSFKNGRKTMTLYEYFIGLAEHDEQLFKEVQEVLNSF